MTKRLFGLLLLSLAVACSSSSSPAPAPTPTATTPVLQSVSLAASLSNFTRVGTTAQAVATGTFSNGTTQDVTTTCANWASDNVSVLTVNSTGLMTAQSSGTAVISTVCQGITARGSVTLNLTPPTPTTFNLTGTVTDGTSHGILPNIDIQVTSGGNAGRATKTDSTGKYALSGLSAGSFTVSASAVSYVTTTQAVNLTANAVLDFVLPRVGAPAPPSPTPGPTPVPGPNGPTCAASSVPAGVTAVCNDGSFSMSQNRSGTCSSHQGVACWICPGILCQ